jgi:nucleoside-diphosphate-sugar epimerase
MLTLGSYDDVIVTGAAGWLGSSIVRNLLAPSAEVGVATPLRAGGRVRALVLPGESIAIPAEVRQRIDVTEGDIADAETCRALCRGGSGGLLLHAAGVIHPRRVSDFYRVNVKGTETVLREAAKAGAAKVVVVSSNSPCGCNPEPNHAFTEASPYNPYMHYGRSKMLMEQSVRAAQADSRLPAVIIRAPWFYGPHQPPRQTLFFRMIRDGKAPVVGSGENLRSMTYIDNLVQGLFLAAGASAANGQTYWIADAEPYTMNQVVNTVERLMENEFGIPCSHGRLRLPGAASEVAWVCDWLLQSLGLYHQKIHVLSEMNRTIVCSIDKARTELGYAPRIGLEEGMRRSLQWVLATESPQSWGVKG